MAEPAVAELENSLNIRLPESYRRFLLENNGGRPVPDGFHFKGKTRGSSVDWFLGLLDGEANDLKTYLRIYRERLPPNFFPIACDPGDNLICISVSGADKGSIYFWDYEREGEPSATGGYSNVIPVADSFHDFIKNLHETKI